MKKGQLVIAVSLVFLFGNPGTLPSAHATETPSQTIEKGTKLEKIERIRNKRHRRIHRYKVIRRHHRRHHIEHRHRRNHRLRVLILR